MPDIVFDIIFADSKWWFRSPSRESSFPSKIEAIEAALRSAQFQNEVCLRVHRETGQVEGELTIAARKPPPSAPEANVRPRKEINRDTARSIQYYSGRPAELVSKRIAELEQEIPLEAFV